MSYQVLARKLRPDTFDALIGQDHVVRALRHALDNDRVHHAFLLTGTRGVGKTTIARILARCLNCEQGVTSSPCGECANCRDVSAGRFVDLLEVDAASRTGVDDVRELLESTAYPPAIGRYKVLLIDEVHQLSTHAFNAMLKTLEEPPEHVKFILATTEAKKVPVTILSRCLQFQLRNISAAEIAQYLASVLATESINAEPEALEVIGRAAAGSVRDALSLTDQVIAYGAGEIRADAVNQMLGLVGREEVDSVLSAIAAGDAERVMAVSAELAERSANFAQILADLQRALHEASVCYALGQKPADSIAGLSAEQVQLCYQIAILGVRDLTFAPDERVGFEMTLLRMLHFSPTESGRSVPRLARDERSDSSDSDSAGEAEEPEPAAPVASSASTIDSEPSPAVAPAVEVSSTSNGPTTGPIPILGEAWYNAVAEAPLKGVARMILEHAGVSGDESRVVLTLEPRHEMLISERHRAQIESWLGGIVGAAVTVEVKLGEPGCESVDQRRSRLAAERLAAAQAALAADSTVRLLIDEFGGHLSGVEAWDSDDAASA